MLIAYLTTDEVNEQLALQMAEERGETLCTFLPCDAPPDEDFDVAVYDWDYLPLQLQQTIRAQLLADQVVCPAAVHGYNLDDDCIAALRKHNVAVYRTLQPELFRRLARKRRQARTTPATGIRAEKEQISKSPCLAGSGN